jgi:hypothetical protein
MSKASVTRPCHRSQSHVAKHCGWGLGWHGRLAGRCRGGCTCPTNGMETAYQVRLGGTIAYTPLWAASRNLHGPTHQRPLDRRRMAAAQHLHTHMSPKKNQSRDNDSPWWGTAAPPPLLPLAHSPAPLGRASPDGAAPSSLPSPLPSSPSCRVASTGRSRTASRARSRDPAPRLGEASPPLDAPVPTRDCMHKYKTSTGSTGGQEGER